MVKNCHMVSQKPKYCKSFERNSHWRKLSMIMVWEHYCYASPKPEFFFIFFAYIFIHISANMSPFGLKFSQMILHTETVNWWLFVQLMLSLCSFAQANTLTQYLSWCFLKCKFFMASFLQQITEADPGLSLRGWGGGGGVCAKYYVCAHTSWAWSPKSLTAGVQGLLNPN